jgi:hypothetical protein
VARSPHDFVQAASGTLLPAQRPGARADTIAVTFTDGHAPDHEHGHRAAALGYGLLVVRARVARAAIDGPGPARDELAKRIAGATPADAVVAPLDRDTFCVALDVRDDVDALLRAEAVLGAFDEPLYASNGKWRVVANIGVALRPPGALRTSAGLLREARTALVQATRLGGGCALLFDPAARHLLPPAPCRRRRHGL